MAGSRRISSFNHSSTATPLEDQERPTSGEDKKELWSSLLNGVSSGKRLPEKNVLVLGGTSTAQRDFLETVSIDSASRRRPPDKSRLPPVANRFALGYTYQDVLDIDQEDIIARLSLYLLSNPSTAFTPLIRPLLTTRTIPDMLVVILLDWNQPWQWARQLRSWIRVLRSLVQSLDDDCKIVLEENIHRWQRKGRASTTDGSVSIDGDTGIHVGPGEWDEPLGIPVCVVCQNANKIEQLERERGWKDDEFDFIVQYLRTVLMKHGASLIYTMPSAPGSLQELVHSSLDIPLSSKRSPIKPNHTDRDRVLIPPNWDSWGKTRIIKDGFDIENVSQAWSIDIQVPRHMQINNTGISEEAAPVEDVVEEEDDGSAVAMYEDMIKNPGKDAFDTHTSEDDVDKIEIETVDTQHFLTEQLEILEKLRLEDEQENAKKTTKKINSALISNDSTNDVVEKHIGRVQINMGGIQVDADDMVRGLKEERESSVVSNGDDPPVVSSAREDLETEKLKSFFAKLGQTGRSSPSGTSK